MNETWGFKSYDDQWKSVETLVRNVIDTASKGGNYLLNVGPTAAGEIPQPSVERLAGIGKWMKVNGDAIYGTTAGPFRTQLAWGRATAKPGKLYLHVFNWPTNGALTLPGYTARVTRAQPFPTNFLTGNRMVLSLCSPSPMPLARDGRRSGDRRS